VNFFFFSKREMIRFYFVKTWIAIRLLQFGFLFYWLYCSDWFCPNKTIFTKK